jgi:hypothetical protein
MQGFGFTGILRSPSGTGDFGPLAASTNIRENKDWGKEVRTIQL